MKQASHIMMGKWLLIIVTENNNICHIRLNTREAGDELIEALDKNPRIVHTILIRD